MPRGSTRRPVRVQRQKQRRVPSTDRAILIMLYQREQRDGQGNGTRGEK